MANEGNTLRFYNGPADGKTAHTRGKPLSYFVPLRTPIVDWLKIEEEEPCVLPEIKLAVYEPIPGILDFIQRNDLGELMYQYVRTVNGY